MSDSPFGAFVRRKREEVGKTLREVADALDVSHVYLSKVERGKSKPLAEKHWSKLAEMLNVEVTELEDLAEVSRPIQLDLANASKTNQELGLVLARRIEQDDLADDDARQILEFLKKQ